jgi:hypothetical protein
MKSALARKDYPVVEVYNTPTEVKINNEAAAPSYRRRESIGSGIKPWRVAKLVTGILILVLALSLVWMSGINKGRRQGFDEGFEFGKSQAQKESYARGFVEGHSAGYDKGFEAGSLGLGCWPAEKVTP